MFSACTDHVGGQLRPPQLLRTREELAEGKILGALAVDHLPLTPERLLVDADQARENGR